MKKILVFIILVLCMSTLGCATGGHYPLDYAKRAELGKSVGIRVHPVVVNPIVDTPFMHYRPNVSLTERLSGAGHQAVNGAAIGAKTGAYLLAGGCGHGKGCLVILALALATSVTGATIGGVTGAVSGALAGKVDIDPEVAELINRAGIPQKLEETIFTDLTKLPSHTFLRVSGPNVQNQPIGDDHSALIEPQDMHSIIELALKKMAFVGSSPTGPHHLSIHTVVTIVRQSDHKLISRQGWRYDSDESYPLTEWQADDGRLMSDTLNHYYRHISRHIKSEFFGESTTYYSGN